MTRIDALGAVYAQLERRVVVTIMGAVAAELQSLGHRPNFFYLQHAMGLAEHGRLVVDVQQRFLAHARVECRGRERQSPRIAADDRHPTVQAHQAAEPGGPRGPPGVELDAHDTAAAAAGQEARRAGEPRAQVQYAPVGVDAGQPRERVDGREPAIVVLVIRKEIVRREPSEITAARPA